MITLRPRRWDAGRRSVGTSTQKRERDRQMRLLHEQEGLSYEQLAERFGLSKSGVASAIWRERRRTRP